MIKPKLVIGLLIVASFMSFATIGYSYDVQHTTWFSQDELSFDKIMGYDVVMLKDGSNLAELGKPMLPAKQIQIALPEGMEVRGVRIISTIQEEIPGEFNIFPAQPPRKIGLFDEDIEFVEPDKDTYSSNQPYPTNIVEFTNQGDLAGQSIAVFLFYPLQYIPSEKKLTLHTSVIFAIEGVGGYECSHYLSPNISERGKRDYEKMLKGMVHNPQDVYLRMGTTGKSTVLPDGSFDHVIITGPLHATWYSELVLWHNQKGLRDTVITTDWIVANYSGSTTKEKIRNFIIDANTNWGTMYVLLGGEHETVPFEYRTYVESTPSDQYYSDIYNNDWIYDVYVGRCTGENGFEIQTFVFKVLDYEKDPPRTDYPLDITLLGMDYDDFTHVELLKEDIDSNYIPSRFKMTKVYDSDASYHKADFINALNAGQNLVNHADHSNSTVMGTGDHNHGWYIQNSDVDALTNYDQLSVIVTPGCHPNHMDHNDCIAEHFVIYNPNKAGVAFTGNTRNGLYYQGQWASLSNGLDREWWISVFSRDKYNLGQILADAKHNFSHSSSSEKHCEWTFNLLGEPEMPIWTDEPDSFAVSCPDIITEGKWLFEVHVKDSTTQEPVDLAYVCLWKENEVYLTGYTDTEGDVTFHPLPTSPGNLYVTVTKHNWIPFQKVVDIPFLCGDINIPGGDGVVDVGDVVYLTCYLYRGCPEPVPVEAADCNLDGVVDVGDVVYLVNYLYKGGPPPCDPTYPTESR